MERIDTPIIPNGIKYKCVLCDFTYIWLNTLEDNKIANDHTNSHEQKPPTLNSWIEVIETVSETAIISGAPKLNIEYK